MKILIISELMYKNIKTTEAVRNIFEIMEKNEELEDATFLAHKSQDFRDVYKVYLLSF